VDVINQLAKQIASVNDQIAKTRGSGHTPNDLLDQRDQKINERSGYFDVQTIEQQDGTMSVMTGSGITLV
ncbi:FlgK family flagellar hook-associated protein, partial [Serratia marcescens]|uniref:FlgK family flagellar hook-associated protein n=1 Tax=Serratia marcescens TaxID=615 RepID=UPI003C727C32